VINASVTKKEAGSFSSGRGAGGDAATGPLSATRAARCAWVVDGGQLSQDHYKLVLKGVEQTGHQEKEEETM